MVAADVDLPARLHVQGAKLIKPNGHEFTPRGVNLGAVGEDVPEDATAIAALNANCVRVALRWWTPYGDDGHGGTIESRDNDGFAFLRRSNVQDWLDKITQASAAGLWVVPFIDSNCGQSGTQDPKTIRYCDPYGTWGAQGRNFFTDAAMRRVFATVVWPTLAAKLRTIAKIAFLEIQPECLDGRGPEWAAAVADFYRECIAAIREVDADTPFLIGARNGYDIRLCDEVFLEERKDIVYTGNLLNQWVVNLEKFDEGLGALCAMRDARDVPVFVQQLGRKTGEDRNLKHMRAALQRMTDAEVGFTWWQWKQNTSNPDSYALNFKRDDGAGWTAKDDEQALLSEYL